VSRHIAIEGDLRDRILHAALRCIGRWGVAKTSLDDIAREANCSRASVYRTFPGGKESLLHDVAANEVQTFFQAVDSRLRATSCLEDMLIAGVEEALSRLREHQALGFLAQFEPDRLSLAPSATGMGRVLPPAVQFTSARLERFVPAAVADEASEWIVRIVLSYAAAPPVTTTNGPHHPARLVRGLLLPAISRLVESAPPALT
jgi:AcrR family transcriptional regulator